MNKVTYPSVEDLISNREVFNEFVYTPLDIALEEFDKRKIDNFPIDINDVPEILMSHPSAVLFRHVATPNYETRRFISILDTISELKPVILEYTKDKFTNENYWKYSLGKIPLYKGRDKNGNIKLENISVIDFNNSNSKSIGEVQTLNGKNLVDLHHQLFSRIYPDMKDTIFDLSDWIQQHGQNAKLYYLAFFSLFIKNGILFENFLLEGKELKFTQDVVLPAFIEIYNKTGLKPLIVSLEPTDTEGDHFWLCHPYEDKEFINCKPKAVIKNIYGENPI